MLQGRQPRRYRAGREGSHWAMTKTGPNDVSSVVRALGEFFFSILKTKCCFIDSNDQIHNVEGSYNENGPR
jgi:hypothetical protein